MLNRQSKRFALTVLSLAVTSALAAAATTAHAASAPDAGATDNSVATLPTVSVTADDPLQAQQVRAGAYVAKQSDTATKTNTPLVETPQSISVITAGQMQDQAVQSVGQALRYTAGVIGEEYGGLNTTIDYFMVRGFPNQFPFIDGLSTETYFTLLAPAVNPYGLERIDVLRGPSSVLYGQNIPGGLINLVTKHPTDEPIHEISVDTGSHGDVGARFDLGGPANSDGTVLYRLTGDTGTTGSQQHYYHDTHAYIAPSITWQPSADTHLTLLTHFDYRRSGYATGDLPSEGTLHSVNGMHISPSFFDGDPDHNKIERSEAGIGYEFEHRFSPALTVRQNVRYTHVNLNEDIVGSAGLEDDDETLDRYGYKANASSESIAVDNQAQFNFATGPVQHTALLGFDYLRSTDHWAENDATEVPSINVYNPVRTGSITYGGVDYDVRHHLDQYGIYAQDQAKLDHWVGTFSVRQDWAKTDEYDFLAGDTDQSNVEDRTTWRAGLVYLFDNGLAPYVSYSTSFLPGLGTTYDGTPLKPTTGQSVEVGVKYQPKGYNSFAMLSLYNTLEKNVTEPDYVHTDGDFVVQTGAQRVKGVELSGVADMGTGWKTTLAYTYMQGTIVNSDEGYAGNQAANVPHNMASAWVDKTFHGGVLNGFGAGAGVRYVGAQFGDEANDVKMPSVTLIDAALHYDYDRHWRFSLNASNLFNRKYVNCQGTDYCSYGVERTVIARATYRW